MDRSYLFAPGHNEKLLGRVFDAGADAVNARPRGQRPARRQAASASDGRHVLGAHAARRHP